MPKKSTIQKYIDAYSKHEDYTARFVSFDFCYGYFQDNKQHLLDDIEKSCFVLWGYLASWGMLRGRGSLPKRNPAVLKPLIVYLNSIKSHPIWQWDVMDYKDNGTKIMGIYNQIGKCLEDILQHEPTQTLITKIMLGVFGCIPAFDRYFKAAFCNLEDNGLDRISQFYIQHHEELNSTTIYVYNFNGEKSNRIYPKAKLIDMYGFQKGYEMSKTKEKAEKPLSE